MVHIKIQAHLKRKKSIYLPVDAYFAQNILCMFNAIKLLYCIVLYCIVLYCIVLYCIVLYCIVARCSFHWSSIAAISNNIHYIIFAENQL